MKKEVLERAKRVAEAAEVFLVDYEETPVNFEANRLKQVLTRQGTALALRIIREGRIGFASTTRLDDSQTLVDMAVEMSPFGPRAFFKFPTPGPHPGVEVYDPGAEAVAIEAMVELGDSVIAQVRKHTPGLICHVGVTRRITSVHILNSRGGETSYNRSTFSLSLWGNLIRGTDMLFVGDSESSCHPLPDGLTLAGEVIRQLELARNQARVASGRLPVVFTPLGVASALIPPLALAFNGRTVWQGASPLGGRRGERVFDERLSLWDDATIPYQPGSYPWDDEGVPGQRTPLVEKGRVAGFIYDLQMAGLSGTSSTGNGSRGPGGMPTPSPSSLVVAEGEAHFEDMVKDMREGLVVEELMGAEQGNLLSGDFSGNVLLGYKVERGEIVGRVKDTMVSGNVYQALKGLAAIGKEARWVGGWLRTPALYCSGLSVVSKG